MRTHLMTLGQKLAAASRHGLLHYRPPCGAGLSQPQLDLVVAPTLLAKLVSPK